MTEETADTIPVLDFALIQYFVPDELSGTGTPQEYRVRILLMAICALCGAALVFAGVYYVLLSSLIPSLVAAGAVVMAVAAAFVLRHTRFVTVVGYWIALTLAVAVIGVALFSGGIFAHSAPWMVLLPLFATLFSGWRTGLGWGMFGIVALVVLAVLQVNDIAVQQLFDEQSLPIVWTLANSFLVVLVLLFFVLYSQFQGWLADRLKGKSAQLEAILDTAPNGIITVDQRGTVRAANRAAQRMFERTERELRGTRVTKLIPTLDFENTGYKSYSSLARQSTLSGQTDHRGVRSDGEKFPLSMTINPFEGPPANQAVLVVRDDTEIRRMRAQMMQMDRMSAVGTLATGVGHEINNPLSYIKGNLEYVHRCIDHELGEQPDVEGLDVDDLLDAIEDSLHGLGRIEKIVGDLRAFASGSEGEKLQAVDLEESLDSAIAIARNEIRHRAELTRHYDHPPPVLADAEGLGQVFLNLLLNAAQAIPEGHADKHEIKVHTRVDDDYVIASIVDTGTGIEQQNLDRVFDPFFTTKDPDEGTGLGLAISQKIVNEMGGIISVESQQGEGSTFSVRLPIAPVDDTSSGRPANLDLSLPEASGGKVLIVDDEPKVCQALKRSLSGFDVECKTNPPEALDELLEEDEKFDFVLVDLLMPNLGGRQFYETLSEHAPNIAERIIIITGGAFTADSKRFLEDSGVPWLTKPVDPIELYEILEERNQGDEHAEPADPQP